MVYADVVDRDSLVGITTHYGPGIKFRRGERFSVPVQTGSGDPPIFLYNGYRVIPGGKSAGVLRLLTSPSITEVIERIELYFYFPSGPCFTVLGQALNFSVRVDVSSSVNSNVSDVL